MEQTQQAVNPKELWAGVALGPLVWAIHLVVSYVIVSLYCKWGFFSTPVLGRPGYLVLILGATLIAVALVLFGGYLAYKNWKPLRWTEARNRPLEERYWFMARSGLFLSALFAFVILVSAVPALVVQPCW